MGTVASGPVTSAHFPNRQREETASMTVCRTLILSVAIVGTASARAGYQAPVHIDGCQSRDGRFVVTAEQVGPPKKGQAVFHGPHQWRYTWKDNETGETREYPAQGVSGGQIYAHLFIAPDGETFALWNHISLYWPKKSHMHVRAHLPESKQAPGWRTQEAFSRRLIIYNSKDGSIVREMAIADFLEPEEWKRVGKPYFNRVEWLVPYDGMNFKQTLRHGYAFYRVSPDYTVLQFQVKSPEKRGEPRVVNVSLTDGNVLDETPSDLERIPVRPFNGPAEMEGKPGNWRGRYVPSLDPVRTAGKFREFEK